MKNSEPSSVLTPVKMHRLPYMDPSISDENVPSGVRKNIYWRTIGQN